MRIVIDGDACPVKEITIEVAKQNDIEVIIFFDTAHVYQNDYATVKFFDKGADSVDFAIISEVKKDDIIITNDYGLAGMILAKGCKALTAFGLEINNFNIEQLLGQRYINQQARKAKVRTKGPKKRTLEDDMKYEQQLIKIIKTHEN